MYYNLLTKHSHLVCSSSKVQYIFGLVSLVDSLLFVIKHFIQVIRDILIEISVLTWDHMIFTQWFIIDLHKY